MTAGRRRAEGRTDPPQPSRPGLVPCCVLSLGGSATGPFPHRPPQSTRPSREQEGDTDKAGAPAGGSMPMTEAEAVGRLHALSRAGRALRPPSHARRHRAAEKSAAAPSPAGVWAQVTGLGGRALCGAPGHPHVLPRCHAAPPGNGRGPSVPGRLATLAGWPCRPRRVNRDGVSWPACSSGCESVRQRSRRLTF